METIKMQCKSISQIYLGICFMLKEVLIQIWLKFMQK